MKELIIIGAGNVGGFLALNQNLFKKKFKILGFLDDDPKKIGKQFWDIPVLGSIGEINNYSGVSVAVGISSPLVKKRILEKIGLHFDFPNFISKNAWISNKVKIGKGVIIYPNVSINYESVLEDFVIINMNCAIGHDNTIKKCVSLAPGVNFGGFTSVGAYANIGIGACTVQQIKIGEGAIIGGQTILIENVPKNSKVVGNPGRIIKTL